MLFHYKINLSYESDIDAATALLESSGRFVDFFFILSGFVICHVYLGRLETREQLRGFFVSRFARLYPLHLATCLVMLGWVMLQARDGGAPASLPDTLLGNLFLVQAWGVRDQFILNAPSWSISAEYAAYMTFPILLTLVMRYRLAPLFFVGTALLSAALYDVLVDVVGIRWERLGLLRALPLFALGVALYLYRDLLRQATDRMLSALQVVAVAGILICLHNALPLVALLPFFALLILATFEDRGQVARLADTSLLYGLGLISYTLYLLHWPVRAYGYYVWPKINGAIPAHLDDSAFVLACICVTLGLSVLVYRLFEMPARQYLRHAMTPQSLLRPGSTRRVN